MSPQHASEKIPQDEKQHIEDLRQRLSAKIQREYQKGVMRRDAHPKTHGVVRAYSACCLARQAISPGDSF